MGHRASADIVFMIVFTKSLFMTRVVTFKKDLRAAFRKDLGQRHNDNEQQTTTTITTITTTTISTDDHDTTATSRRPRRQNNDVRDDDIP